MFGYFTRLFTKAPSKKTGYSFLDDDDFTISTSNEDIPMHLPKAKKPSPSKGLKKAMKQTTTLRKKA